MKLQALFKPSHESALAALMILQSVCAALFVLDIIDDFTGLPHGADMTTHLIVELLANAGLMIAIAVEGLFLRRLLRQQARTEKALSAASGALHDNM
jgi:nitrate reductase gamma subunit